MIKLLIVLVLFAATAAMAEEKERNTKEPLTNPEDTQKESQEMADFLSKSIQKKQADRELKIDKGTKDKSEPLKKKKGKN